MRFLLVFIFVCTQFFNGKVNALQKPVPTKSTTAKIPMVLKTDSSNVQFRKFSEISIEKYSKQREFIYDDIAPTTMNWWDRFWRWVGELINDLFSGHITGQILKYVLIGLAIVIVIFVVIKLIGIDYKMLARKGENIAIPYEESLENIHEINFDEQLEIALSQQNYRFAVRLLYLKTLKKLSDKQLIDWQSEKTNQTYVLELQDENYRNEFNQLTNQFEYIWYGEFFIDQLLFEPINQSFHQFNQQMK